MISPTAKLPQALVTETGQPYRLTILDGGLGRELLRLGAPFRQPEWSALALMESPELVTKVHELFLEAGCEILTTSNYAVIPFHIGVERFAADGARLTALAGHLAREAASAYGRRVAGSLPPLFGSYRPDLFIPAQAPALLQVIIEALNPYVDLWLVETISSIDEARTAAAALSGDDRPVWLSFSLLDGEESEEGKPCLRSGEPVPQAVQAAIECGASAILFNCSQAEVMSPAVSAAVQERTRLAADQEVGVYANAFPARQKNARANFDLTELRPDLDPAVYLAFVETWVGLGATIIGGCCGIGPDHIAALYRRFKTP